jgi:hypothetical protein
MPFLFVSSNLSRLKRVLIETQCLKGETIMNLPKQAAPVQRTLLSAAPASQHGVDPSMSEAEIIRAVLDPLSTVLTSLAPLALPLLGI